MGRAVNPALVDAQLVGGVAFGIGNSLHETLEYDAGGQLLSGTLMDYALPYASDMPPVEGFYQEVAATTNPLGLRGLGECGNPGLGGAIANAICDALGNGQVGITALPLAPAMVWSQLLRSGSQIEGTGLSSLTAYRRALPTARCMVKSRPPPGVYCTVRPRARISMSTR